MSDNIEISLRTINPASVNNELAKMPSPSNLPRRQPDNYPQPSR
jgi:hypothetical protein